MFGGQSRSIRSDERNAQQAAPERRTSVPSVPFNPHHILFFSTSPVQKHPAMHLLTLTVRPFAVALLVALAASTAGGTVRNAEPGGETLLLAEFRAWATRHGKSYASAELEQDKFLVWSDNHGALFFSSRNPKKKREPAFEGVASAPRLRATRAPVAFGAWCDYFGDPL
jgi:hypothetical protein